MATNKTMEAGLQRAFEMFQERNTSHLPGLPRGRQVVEWSYVGLSYAIKPNGDIVTSDGEPRCVDDLMLRLVHEQAEKEGRKITFTFRRPWPWEEGEL